MPAVWMAKRLNQLVYVFLGEVDILDQRGVPPTQPVDPARRVVDLTLIVLAVGDELLIEVGDVNRAIRRIGEEDGPEPDIGAEQGWRSVSCFESGAAREALGDGDVVVQRIRAE